VSWPGLLQRMVRITAIIEMGGENALPEGLYVPERAKTEWSTYIIAPDTPNDVPRETMGTMMSQPEDPSCGSALRMGLR